MAGNCSQAGEVGSGETRLRCPSRHCRGDAGLEGLCSPGGPKERLDNGAELGQA